MQVIFACPAPTALALLGDGASSEERDALERFEFSENVIYVHRWVIFVVVVVVVAEFYESSYGSARGGEGIRAVCLAKEPLLKKGSSVCISLFIFLFFGIYCPALNRNPVSLCTCRHGFVQRPSYGSSWRSGSISSPP